MLSINHSLAAVSISNIFPVHPLFAFVFGLASHFLIDIIPHGDSSRQTQRGPDRFIMTEEQPFQWRQTLIVSFFDIVLVLIVVFALQFSGKLESPINNSVAIIGGIFPDMAWGGIQLFRIRSLRWFNRGHHIIHNLIPYDIPLHIGLSLQFLFAVIIFSLIYF